jgi:hypothetical protein
MCYCTVPYHVCENKTHKKNILILALEPTQSVSEANWHSAVTGSATNKYSKDVRCSQYLSFAGQS